MSTALCTELQSVCQAFLTMTVMVVDGGDGYTSTVIAACVEVGSTALSVNFSCYDRPGTGRQGSRSPLSLLCLADTVRVIAFSLEF